MSIWPEDTETNDMLANVRQLPVAGAERFSTDLPAD